jgi:hypothetical protein
MQTLRRFVQSTVLQLWISVEYGIVVSLQRTEAQIEFRILRIEELLKDVENTGGVLVELVEA